MNTEEGEFYNWRLKQVAGDKKNKYLSHVYMKRDLYSHGQKSALSDLLEEEVVHLYFFLSLWSHLAHHLYHVGLVMYAHFFLSRFFDETTFLLCHHSLVVFFGIVLGPTREHNMNL
jgi:hypothetical protein